MRGAGRSARASMRMQQQLQTQRGYAKDIEFGTDARALVSSGGDCGWEALDGPLLQVV